MEKWDAETAVAEFRRQAARADERMNQNALAISLKQWKSADHAKTFVGLLTLVLEHVDSALRLLDRPQLRPAYGSAMTLVRPAYEALVKAAWIYPDKPEVHAVYLTGRKADLRKLRAFTGGGESDLGMKSLMCELSGCMKEPAAAPTNRGECCRKDHCDGKPLSHAGALPLGVAERLRGLWWVHEEMSAFVHGAAETVADRIVNTEGVVPRGSYGTDFVVEPLPPKVMQRALGALWEIRCLADLLWVQARLRPPSNLEFVEFVKWYVAEQTQTVKDSGEPATHSPAASEPPPASPEPPTSRHRAGP